MSRRENEKRNHILAQQIKLAKARRDHAAVLDLLKRGSAGITKKDAEALAEHVKHRERQLREAETELEEFLAKR